MNINYKNDESVLKKLIKENITCKDVDENINVIIYYRNIKTKNLIMKNNMCSLKRLIDNTNVIYKYNCPEKNCNFSKNSYIGYTECTLTRRLTYHLQKGSIKEHENTVHNKGLTRKKIVENTKILYKINEFRRLINMEALLIKLNNPYINQQDTGAKRVLFLWG